MRKSPSNRSLPKKKVIAKKSQSKKTASKKTNPTTRYVAKKAKISPSSKIKKSTRYLFEDDPFLEGKKKK